MAIPAVPTVTTIVTQALKRAGRTQPTAVQIAEARDEALQEVKSDIMFKAPTHKNLIATATAVTMYGQQRYRTPSDYNIMDSITLLDGSEEARGLATAGTENTITLASTYNVNEADIIGKHILLTDGPGMTQVRQITNWNNSTKVAYVDVDWSENPTGATSYQVCHSAPVLWPWATAPELDKVWTPTTLGTPKFAVLNGQEVLLYPLPDRASYGLQLRYYVDLSMLDEDGNTFRQLLREWRSLWIQGVAVKSMQRFDEDRYQLELGVYTALLDMLGSQTATVRQVRQEP